MIIFNELEQNTPEWFEERKGAITSSRVKNTLVEKIIGKTEAVNFLVNQKIEAVEEMNPTDGLEEKEAKDLEKLKKATVAQYKKDITALSQWEIEALIPRDMYEEAFTKAQKKDYYRLLAETLGYEDDELEDPRDRGHRLEEAAGKAVMEQEGVTGIEVGFVKREDYEQIALSPDLLIPTTKDEEKPFEGGIELKSPGVVNHLEIWKTREVPSEYFWQIIQYFIVAEVDYMLFGSYNPIVVECPLVVIRIERKDVEEFIEYSFQRQVNTINHIKADVEALTF